MIQLGDKVVHGEGRGMYVIGVGQTITVQDENLHWLEFHPEELQILPVEQKESPAGYLPPYLKPHAVPLKSCLQGNGTDAFYFWWNNRIRLKQFGRLAWCSFPDGLIPVPTEPIVPVPDITAADGGFVVLVGQANYNDMKRLGN